MSGSPGLAVREAGQKLGNEGDPLPDWHVALVGLERGNQGALGVIHGKEDENAAE